jgi:chitin synthase
MKSASANQADGQYIALLNDDKGNGPLKQYFLGETMHGADAGIL